MDITDSLICYRRHLKRRNYSAHTSKNYMNMLRHFVLWVDVPLEAVTYEKLLAYIDRLISKRLKPKTINCHVACISGFYTYLQHEKGITITNPVKKRCRLRLPKPLPRYVPDEALRLFFKVVKTPRGRGTGPCLCSCCAAGCALQKWPR